jgi:hypothetical protein
VLQRICLGGKWKKHDEEKKGFMLFSMILLVGAGGMFE